MKFILEDADDANLLDFGFPNKIQTYSTLRNWFPERKTENDPHFFGGNGARPFPLSFFGKKGKSIDSTRVFGYNIYW